MLQLVNRITLLLIYFFDQSILTYRYKVVELNHFANTSYKLLSIQCVQTEQVPWKSYIDLVFLPAEWNSLVIRIPVAMAAPKCNVKSTLSSEM